MARPVTISDEQILEAARTVFLRDGVNASTIEIARLARISEASIFRRFPTKDALFRAAVKPPAVPAWVRELDGLVGVGDLRENLVHVARQIIHLSQQILPLAMVGWGNKPDMDPSGAGPSEPEESPILRDRRRLVHYLAQEAARGRLRPCDVDVVARMLFGPCLTFVMESIFVKQPLTPGDVDAFARSLVDALWDGIAPA